jgi:hypothetical protein
VCEFAAEGDVSLRGGGAPSVSDGAYKTLPQEMMAERRFRDYVRATQQTFARAEDFCTTQQPRKSYVPWRHHVH